MSFTNSVNVNQSLINPVVTLNHDLCEAHLVSLPVTEVVIRARFLQIRRLADDHLTQFVDKVALTA